VQKLRICIAYKTASNGYKYFGKDIIKSLCEGLGNSWQVSHEVDACDWIQLGIPHGLNYRNKNIEWSMELPLRYGGD